MTRDGVKILVFTSSDGGMDAMLSGKLAVVQGGRLGVDAEGTELLVAWSAETDISDHDDLSVSLGSDTQELGEDIELAGRAVEIATASQLPDIPKSCHFEEIFVANSD